MKAIEERIAIRLGTNLVPVMANRAKLAVAIAATALVTVAGASASRAADSSADSEEPTAAEFTLPRSTVELGAGWVSDSSYKFGEYNGLQSHGFYGIGNFDLRGGGRYDSDDLTRWHLRGSDLDLQTRSLSADYGQQGRYRLDFDFDQLRRNRSDSYQTPYLGAGTNVLTLPPNWLVPLVPRVSATAQNARGLSSAVAQSSALVAGVLTAPTAAQLATSTAIIAADVPAFRNYDLHTQRTRFGAGLLYFLGPQWDFKVNAHHEDKDGTKPMGTITATTGGDISTTIPDLIDQTTDQFNVGLNYRGAKDFLQFAYYGSLFKNNVKSMTWTNWASPATTMTMSSAPGNQFHQLSVTGGHSFSTTTRLVANIAYARNTEDDAFLVDTATPLVPRGSPDAEVITKSFNVKLTSRPVESLNLAFGYKFDDRDNRTPVNIYGFYDANAAAAATNINAAFAAALGVPAASLASNININANRPYSKKLNQANVDLDYRLTGSQWLKGGYEFQKIDRTCPGSWIDCADAATTKEHTLRAEWRANLHETVDAHIDFAYSRRTVGNYNENAFLAIVPMADVSPTGATGGASAYSFMVQSGLTGYGPVLGFPATPLTGNQQLFFPNNNALANALYANVNRISELIGMRRFNMADRNRNKLRSALDWQASERLALTAGLDFNRDEYARSVYGLQNARNWALNFNGNYVLPERLTLSAYYTHEDQQVGSAGNSYTANSNAANVAGNTLLAGNSGCNTFTTLLQRNLNNKIDPCLNWSTDMRDKIDTVGLAFSKPHLLSRKIELTGDASFSRARSDNDVSGGNYANNPLAVAGAPAGTIAAYFIPATPLPTVRTDVIALRLIVHYSLSKSSAMRVGYAWQHLKSDDYAYEGMQFGGLSGVLPTNQTAPSYSVHTVGVSYVGTFH